MPPTCLFPSTLSIGLAVALFAVAMAPLPAAAQSGVPVMVGGDADYDACSSVGQVARLNPNGDGFLAVRSGPSTDHGKIDELYNGDIVFLCDQDGRWHGVVYGAQDCGVGSPIPRRQAYNGNCRAGWIFDRYVDVIAG